jgi:phosphonate transport system substrate-binding protein
VGVEVIARPIKDGVSQYRGLIFTRKDSGIKDWEDMKGQSFAMIKATTAAEVFPKMFFKNHGVANLANYLGEIRYVGSHDMSILKVLNGEIAAGAAKDLIYEKLVREDPRIEKEMVVLARSAPVPENALVVRRNIDFVCFNCHQEIGSGGSETGLSVDLKEKIKEILLRLPETAEGREVLRQFGADRFMETTQDDYRELYQMIENLEIDLKTYPYGKRR